METKDFNTIVLDDYKWCNILQPTEQMKLKDKHINSLNDKIDEQSIEIRELKSQVKLLTKIIKS